MLTRFALAAAALLTLPGQAATTIDDPVKFVRHVYANWESEVRVHDDEIVTPRLAALMALDNREAHGEVGRGNDFSFWCNCQDGEIKHATVRGWAVENADGRRVVAAKFDLDSRKQEIEFYFENTKKGWKLDDVRLLGNDGWTLSLILKYGWPPHK